MRQEIKEKWEKLQPFRQNYMRHGWMINLFKIGFNEQEVDEVFEELDEEVGVCKDTKELYYRQEVSKIREQIRGFTEESDKDWVVEQRLQFLKDLKEKKEKKLVQKNKEYFEMYKKDEPYWKREIWNEQIQKLQKELNRINMEIRIKESGEEMKDQITSDMIVRAKEYPIENLVEVNKIGFAVCPFHSDKNPSLYCKNNFYHCFSCNAHGDTIDLLVKRDSLTFQEAVKRLC